VNQSAIQCLKVVGWVVALSSPAWFLILVNCGMQFESRVIPQRVVHEFYGSPHPLDETISKRISKLSPAEFRKEVALVFERNQRDQKTIGGLRQKFGTPEGLERRLIWKEYTPAASSGPRPLGGLFTYLRCTDRLDRDAKWEIRIPSLSMGPDEVHMFLLRQDVPSFPVDQPISGYIVVDLSDGYGRIVGGSLPKKSR
jgi:hypothetical protein